MRHARMALGILMCGYVAGCSSDHSVPTELASDTSVAFDQVDGNCPPCHDPTPQERVLIENAVNAMPWTFGGAGGGSSCNNFKVFVMDVFSARLGIVINDGMEWGPTGPNWGGHKESHGINHIQLNGHSLPDHTFTAATLFHEAIHHFHPSLGEHTTEWAAVQCMNGRDPFYFPPSLRQ
jgi:hypothetical protein